MPTNGQKIVLMLIVVVRAVRVIMTKCTGKTTAQLPAVPTSQLASHV